MGESGFPKHIQKQITEEPSIHTRCGSVIGILESYPVEGDAGISKLKKGEVVRRNNNTFYFGGEWYPILCTIEEVDTSRKWTIDEYDGAESIKYLEPVLVSEELNYWKEVCTCERQM